MQLNKPSCRIPIQKPVSPVDPDQSSHTGIEYLTGNGPFLLWTMQWKWWKTTSQFGPTGWGAQRRMLLDYDGTWETNTRWQRSHIKVSLFLSTFTRPLKLYGVRFLPLRPLVWVLEVASRQVQEKSEFLGMLVMNTASDISAVLKNHSLVFMSTPQRNKPNVFTPRNTPQWRLNFTRNWFKFGLNIQLVSAYQSQFRNYISHNNHAFLSSHKFKPLLLNTFKRLLKS